MSTDADFAETLAAALPSKPSLGRAGGAGPATSPQWLSARFAIYDEESWPADSSVPLGWITLSAAQRHMGLEYMRDILKFFEVYTKDDGTRIGSIAIQIQHLLAVEKVFPTGSGVEGMLLELMLNRCVQAGVSGGESVQCHRILLELCKARSVTVPPALASGAAQLYGYVPATDVAAWRETAQWLSFHLINFELKWPYWKVGRRACMLPRDPLSDTPLTPLYHLLITYSIGPRSTNQTVKTATMRRALSSTPSWTVAPAPCTRNK